MDFQELTKPLRQFIASQDAIGLEAWLTENGPFDGTHLNDFLKLSGKTRPRTSLHYLLKGTPLKGGGYKLDYEKQEKMMDLLVLVTVFVVMIIHRYLQ